MASIQSEFPTKLDRIEGMKITSIEVKNFRAIKHAKIDCIDLNTFVGPNGAGKSTILQALNVFFGEVSSFSETDFWNRETERPIQITVTFNGLSEAARDDFSHYVRSGLLVVQADVHWKDGSGKLTLKGQRMVFEKFSPFFEAKSAKEAASIYAELRGEFSDLPNRRTKSDQEQALRNYEESLSEELKSLVLSEDELFGVSKGKGKFARHVSWVYIPAVKDAASEAEEARTSHLGKLIERTIRNQMDYQQSLDEIQRKAFSEYSELLDAQRTHLKSLQTKLSERLSSSVTADAGLKLDWKKDQNQSVVVKQPTAHVLLTDLGFEGEVDKFGHGLQRAFLLAILQELMESGSDSTPTLLLGCEEPELYQHPPQARHLAQVLMALAQQKTQVFLTTHSPYFVDVEFYEGIKLFQKTQNGAIPRGAFFQDIIHGYKTAFPKPLRNDDQLRAKLAIQAQPKYNEIFFAEKIVLVEGISDKACLETYLRLSGQHERFLRSGTSILVCEGKSSLAFMLLIASRFHIPRHVIMDCDGQEQEPNKRSKHIADNNAIFGMIGRAQEADMPIAHTLEKGLTAWRHTIEEVLETEFGDHLEACKNAGSLAVGQLGGSSKNPVFVAAAMAHAWEEGVRFPVLSKVVNNILES